MPSLEVRHGQCALTNHETASPPVTSHQPLQDMPLCWAALREADPSTMLQRLVVRLAPVPDTNVSNLMNAAHGQGLNHDSGHSFRGGSYMAPI